MIRHGNARIEIDYIDDDDKKNYKWNVLKTNIGDTFYGHTRNFVWIGTSKRKRKR